MSKILVIGLGLTGLSVVRFCASRGWQVAVTDSRAEPPGLDELAEELPDVAVFCGELPELVLANTDQVVVSPGVPLQSPLVQAACARGLPVFGDIELFAKYVAAPVVAITGSNGKSTVTTLVTRMLAASGIDVRVGGNIGTPALELLHDSDGVGCYVLELSSFQLESTSNLELVAAACLNISADHMDRYDSIDAYAQAKARIFDNAELAVVNLDDGDTVRLTGFDQPVVGFSIHQVPVEGYGYGQWNGQWYLYRDGQRLLAAAELAMAGTHNVANALAALALALAAGAELDACLAVLKQFPGLPHRTEVVSRRAGVLWVNDSKGTNVGATVAAIHGLEPLPAALDQQDLILLAGGVGKDADFAPLSAAAERIGVALLFGQDAPLLAQCLQVVVPQVEMVADLAAAVNRAAELARVGDTVLLSPACASFDQFAGFEQRGQAFVGAVKALDAEGSA